MKADLFSEQISYEDKIDRKKCKKYIDGDRLKEIYNSYACVDEFLFDNEEEGMSECHLKFHLSDLFAEVNRAYRHKENYFAAEAVLSCGKTSSSGPSPLENKEIEARVLYFVSICDRLSKEKTLKSVYDFMEKESDGSLKMDCPMVLAALQVVGDDGKYLQLVAEAFWDEYWKRISVGLRETKLTPDSYNASVNSVFLEYLERDGGGSGKAAAKKNKKTKSPSTVKIFYTEPWTNGKRVSIKVPVIAMEDGRCAIDAKPHKALADFECLVGSDEKGYDVKIECPAESYDVCSNGLDIRVEYGTDMLMSSKDLWPRIKHIEEYVSGKTVRDYDILNGVFPVTYDDGEISNNKKHLAFFKKKEYLAEYVYTALCGMDEMLELSRSEEYAQYLADNAVRKKNGMLSKIKHQDIYLPQKVKTEHPVVRMYFRAYNAGDRLIRLSFHDRRPSGDLEWEKGL